MLTTPVMLCLLHVDSLSWRILAFLACARHGKIKLRLSVSIGNTRHIHHFPINFMPHRIFKKLKIDKSMQVCFFVSEGLCVSAVSFLTFQVACWWKIGKGKCLRWNWHRVDRKHVVDGWNLMFFTFNAFLGNFHSCDDVIISGTAVAMS